MTFDEANAKAKELNLTGKHRENWYYYPAYYDGENPLFIGSHFVMRRLKKADLRVAVFGDGRVSISEQTP